MHALLLPIGSTGDVLPFVAIGRALRARGHDVTVAGNPHFASLIARAGLDFAAVGDADEYEAMCNNPKLMDRVHGFRFVMDFVSTLIRPAVTERVSRGADLTASIADESCCDRASVAAS